ncbi:MAG: NADH-quinone oxidoreductase subunit L [Verrucomicrobiota bacterium JB023]|nr:NADH-quinone oxidoreductase subunit L [Verrucomicrobiota bacterium JB023]
MPWLILLLPLASAALIHLGLKRNGTLAAWLATASALATLVLTYLTPSSADPVKFSWATFEGLDITIGLIRDELAMNMMLIVTGVGTLVHLFSLGYMKDDEAKGRYFCGLSLFMFSMTGIVLADNFIMMFIFWELVGLSSYLLIGHWFTKESAADAAKKAFCVNRIGDWGFMVGILMVWAMTGALSFSQMALPEGVPAIMLGVALLCVFCGAVGKSAQAPLHVWLPDAMEGPTPVSALIHAATMVAAGVYMMARFFFSIDGGEHAFSHLAELFPAFSFQTIAWVGGVTSLLAALMATQQNDIKKVLAYSTLSQLGYMVLAVGLLKPDVAMFHLYTHAWFKALLFLGSGAVIYACHHEQDIWKMGGLFKKMPITAITFALGTLALAGFPLTAGFFSKEQILDVAFKQDKALFALVVVVAFLTTFYMGRLFFITFFGKPRTDHAEKAKEVGPLMWLPLALLAIPSILAGYPFVAEAISPLYHHHPFKLFSAAFLASILAFAGGIALAFVLYFNKDEDALANQPVAKLFANKFYVDEFYAWFVKWFINFKASIIAFLDDFIIGGLLVGGFSRITATLGALFNRAQSGSLQTYSYLMAVGIVAVIFITVFM